MPIGLSRLGRVVSAVPRHRPVSLHVMRFPWKRSQQNLVAVSTEILPAARTERALMTLAVHASQLDGRLDRIEARLVEAAENNIVQPSHADVLAVRIHSAKLAAEMARLAVELQGRLDVLESGRRSKNRVTSIATYVGRDTDSEGTKSARREIIDLREQTSDGSTDSGPLAV